ncbi:MAG: helix-turn-helix domain-containing protein, partial [Bacteroidales bacterium]
MKKIETFCPIRDILSKIGDKWSVLVLLLLEQNEVLRFSEIARQIPDVSQKMLTVTLRSLEALNLVERKIYPEV